MYLSLDPFTQLSIYVYRFTSVFLPPLYHPLNVSLTSNTIPHFAPCRNTIQPFNCRYGYSYSAAVNNRLHVLFLMWGYFFFSKTTILRVRFRQLLDAATPIKRVPTYFPPQNHSLIIGEKRSYLTAGLDEFRVQSSRETWKKCVISYTGALKKNPPPPLNTHTRIFIYISLKL